MADETESKCCNVKRFFKKRGEELAIGVISGVISSAIFAAILNIPALKRSVFDLPKEPRCVGVKIDSENLFQYKWKVEVGVENKSRIAIYNNTDFNIISNTFKEEDEKNRVIYHFGKINKYDSGDYLGFIAYFDRPKDDILKFEFISESIRPLETSTCENFLISL